jgi:hypothetical protein
MQLAELMTRKVATKSPETILAEIKRLGKNALRNRTVRRMRDSAIQALLARGFAAKAA